MLEKGGEKRMKKKIIIGVVVVVLGIVYISSLSNSNHNQSVQTTNSDNKTVASASAKVETWNTVTTLSGSANKDSDTFTLHGRKVKLTYKFTGNTTPVGAIYVLPEGTDISKDGGIPEVMISKYGGDSTFLTKSTGNYYLHITSANADWTVKIEETN